MHSRVVWSALAIIAITMPGQVRAFEPAPVCATPSGEELLVCGEPGLAMPEAVGLCSLDSQPPPSSSAATPSPEQAAQLARESLIQAEALASAGNSDDALLQLRNVERLLPRIADRIALERAGLLLKLGMPREACEAFAVAETSPDRSVAAQAQIGSLRCLIAAGDKRAEAQRNTLFTRYPLLGERFQLELELALAREAWGNPASAAQLLRRIDLEAPASVEGARARSELAQLFSQGVRVAPFSTRERVERAERLLRNGPIEPAIAEAQALREDHTLTAEVRARVDQLWDRITRRRGGFQHAPAVDEVPIVQASAPLPVADTPAQAISPELQVAERKVRSIRGVRPLSKLSSAQVRTLFELAIAHDMRALCDELLETMVARRSLVPEFRFDAAIRASGLAAEDKRAALLETLLEVPKYRVAARYHYARALESLGRGDEAAAHYQGVIDNDRSDTPYYAMWAELRRRALSKEPASSVANLIEFRVPDARDPVAQRVRALQLLRPIATRYGSTYPWLQRAVDLVQLQRFDAAADELNEALLAWRDASGAPRLRSGLVALITGSAPPRRPMTNAERAGRRALDRQARQALSETAALLGDPGIGLRFGAWRPDSRPRAYAALVQNAAREYGLDPNLLFAVMRVESIYNRRIVSNAGAIGLMQIMPSTGRRIAQRMGVESFEVKDLLDPRLNVEFSAWYLASLLERFDGRLPLAVASYNGGPHNVRAWMRQAPDMPLDAFLERIPFTETHRYVRRVLTHYAAYRAQQNLPMTGLSVELPTLGTDETAF